MTRFQFAMSSSWCSSGPGQRQFLLLTGQVTFNEFTRTDVYGRLVFAVINVEMRWIVLPWSESATYMTCTHYISRFRQIKRGSYAVWN